MNSSHPYFFFNLPVSRRAYVWSWLLCPGVAVVIYLSTRSRVAPGGPNSF